MPTSIVERAVVENPAEVLRANLAEDEDVPPFRFNEAAARKVLQDAPKQLSNAETLAIRRRISDRLREVA